MTPLNRPQRESALKRLDFLQTELDDAAALTGLDTRTYRLARDTRRNVERLVENVANALIDLAKIVLAGEEVEIPDTYREAVLALGDIGLVDANLALRLADLVRAQNLLAHEYLDLRWDVVSKFLREGQKDVRELVEAMADLVERSAAQEA